MCAFPKRWRTINVPAQATEALRDELKIHPALCGILAHRGIDDYQKAKFFFRPDLTALHDPFLMKDMPLAVERIVDAIAQQEKILVYGDYDVDGTTAVAIMYDFLTKILFFPLQFFLDHPHDSQSKMKMILKFVKHIVGHFY